MTVHGFAGTFESILYKSVLISIKPDTHTPGMFSWFPMFLPLERPMILYGGDKLTLNVWRCVDRVKVWYEWNLCTPIITPIQNSEGCCYSIALQ